MFVPNCKSNDLVSLSIKEYCEENNIHYRSSTKIKKINVVRAFPRDKYFTWEPEFFNVLSVTELLL